MTLIMNVTHVTLLFLHAHTKKTIGGDRGRTRTRPPKKTKNEQVATPLTNKQYLAAPQGASYGLGSTIQRYAGNA